MNVFQLVEIAFLISKTGQITVMPQTLIEAAALVGLDMDQIWAAVNSSP